MRRWLVVEIGKGAVRAVLHSVPHRLPHAAAVPLGVAARLAAGGVPLVVRRLDDDVQGGAA